MQEIIAPTPIPKVSLFKIFLAGSIEMGHAEHWQEHVVHELADTPVLILNPRRKDWDNSWKQTIDSPEFKKQVLWELDGLAASDCIIMYFDGATRSPISLLELGLYAESGKLLVICPDNFWRKGNVDIVCMRYNIPLFCNLKEALEHFRKKILLVEK